MKERLSRRRKTRLIEEAAKLNPKEKKSLAEDYILGSLALKRDKSAKRDDFVNLDEW